MKIAKETRQSLLAAARVEFARYGFEGARVDRIAKRAKVNKAMIYYHFGAKKQLYETVIEDHLAAKADFMDNLLQQNMTMDEFVFQLAAFYTQLFSDREFLPIFLRELAGGGHRIREILLKTVSRKRLVEKLKDYFKAEVTGGRTRPISIEHAIISFVGMNVFYIAASPVANQIWEIEDVERFHNDRPHQVADLFLNGLKTK